MHVGAIAAVMVLAGALLGSSRAAAQDDAALLRDGLFIRDRNVSVAERPKPEYESLPVRVGAFLVAPSVDGAVTYDDNIYASAAKGAADGIVTIAPSFSLASDWPRNQISGFAKLAQSLYLDHSGEDTTNYAVGLAGRLDARRDLGVAGGLGLERDTEPRTSEASPAGAIHPVQYELAAGWIESAKTFDRLRLTARGSIQDYAFDNAQTPGGGAIDQHDQDRTESVAAGLAEYVYSPELSFLTNLTANRRQYRDAAPGEASRTSSGYEATVGASFDLARLARGEIRVGYLDQAYENPAFKRVNGAALQGKVEYFPTPITTVTATASRSVQDSGIEGVSGYIAETAGVQIDHELLRNLVLSAHLTYADNHYPAYSRKDDIQTAWANASYLMNRVVSLALKYERLIRRSRGADAGQEYAVNRVMAAITCRF
jgi:hypothetical protein